MTDTLPTVRSDRARLRGASHHRPIDVPFELRLLAAPRLAVLRHAARSPFVSTSLLEAMFILHEAPRLRRRIAANARSPLWVVALGLHRHASVRDRERFAHRMERDDLAPAFAEAAPDRDATLGSRWRELGGGAPPARERRSEVPV